MSPFAPLTIRSGALTAQILPHGASLVGLHLQGGTQNLVLGFADPQDHARLPIYAGAIVGPVANRITGGRISLSGQPWQMPRDEGENTLHSGPDGLHSHAWNVLTHSADSLTLGIELKHGEGGLPGNRVIRADYRLTGALLSLTLRAETDRATAMNLAHHPYWNLDGLGDITSHSLRIDAAHYLPTDPQRLPLGAVAPLAETPFDFRSPRPVPRDSALDLNYCLSDAPPAQIRPVAWLTGATGTQLRIATDAPGLQVYNGNFLPDTPGALPGGQSLRPFHAMALEPQYWPDAPHHGHFPQITLEPGRIWQQRTEYRITQTP